MKAAVLRSATELAVEDVADPVPGPGELVLRVGACGICGSDLHAVHAVPPGTVFGHEFCGTVDEVGPEVEGWRTGDRAVALPFFCCGACERCRSGLGVFCEKAVPIGLGRIPGAYAERVRVQARSALALPPALDDRQAALVEPLAVALRAVRRAGLRDGDRALVLGAGPIGLAVTLWANRARARTAVSDPSPARRAMAERLGAAAVVDPTRHDPGSAAGALGADGRLVVFECTGVRGVLGSAMMLAPLHARIVVVGVCSGTDEIWPLGGILKELTIEFVLAYSAAEFAEALGALAGGEIDAAPMVSDVVPLRGVTEAFARLGRPDAACKILVAPGAA